MNFDRRQHLLLFGFVTLSLLLHLLGFALLQRLQPQPVSNRQPVYVEMVPRPRPSIPERERELELPSRTPVPRTRPAERLGPSDQQVERETAPAGRDREDLAPSFPRPAPAQPQPSAAPGTPSTAPPTPAGEGLRPSSPAPNREQLLASATQAATQVAQQEIAQWRQKLREEVERGEAVWLDTEQDLLVSFFKRFKDGIYLVWNYPRAAVERGEQGISLLRITINRAGLVEEVVVVKGSGSSRLDQAAVDAVQKAAPYYGYLPSSYPQETLTIFAFFEYRLGGGFSVFGTN